VAYVKMNFSRSALEGLPPAPAGKRAYYSDTKEPGLLLCVTGAGTKSFQVYSKINGRPVRVTLGRFSPSLADSVELPRDCSHNDFLANNPELNVRMSRALAARVKIDLKAGVNPADTKRAKRGEPTLGELFEEYVERHLIPLKKKRITDTREDFERYLGQLPTTPRKKHGQERRKAAGSVNWQNRPIGNVTKADLQRVILDLSRETGIYAANHALGLMKAMYNKAIEWELFNGRNPAVGIAKFKTRTRERFLQTDELPRFFNSVAEEPSQDVRDYILLSLLTGARKRNVISMRWADVIIERATWTIEGAESKNNDQMVIPLMPEAVEILRSRKPSGAAMFVFPGRGKSGHMEDPKGGWRRVLDRDELTQLTKRINDAGHEFVWPAPLVKGRNDKRRKLESMEAALVRARTLAAQLKIDTTGARIKDLRIHDMRRTLGSWQAATGASLVVIGKSLGHKDHASTQIYSRLNLDPVRDSMQTATRALLAAGGVLPTAEVVPIKKKKANGA
jgi:integrase